MESQSNSLVVELFGSSVSYMRRWLFRVLSVGPLPGHLAFILDGNRRYARKWNLGEGMGHRAGFLSLMTLMKYCNELGIKYITIYAFSIDNFKRKPDEVQYVMDLMLEKIEGLLKEESIVNQYGVRVEFVGNLKLLNETVRVAAEKAMKATANNHRSILLIAVAYTSTDEIAHAAQESWPLHPIQIYSYALLVRHASATSSSGRPPIHSSIPLRRCGRRLVCATLCGLCSTSKESTLTWREGRSCYDIHTHIDTYYYISRSVFLNRRMLWFLNNKHFILIASHKFTKSRNSSN